MWAIRPIFLVLSSGYSLPAKVFSSYKMYPDGCIIYAAHPV